MKTTELTQRNIHNISCHLAHSHCDPCGDASTYFARVFDENVEKVQRPLMSKFNYLSLFVFFVCRFALIRIICSSQLLSDVRLLPAVLSHRRLVLFKSLFNVREDKKTRKFCDSLHEFVALG